MFVKIVEGLGMHVFMWLYLPKINTFKSPHLRTLHDVYDFVQQHAHYNAQR